MSTVATAHHSFQRETAGQYAVREVPIVTADMTIAAVEELLTKESSHFVTINYLYVVDGLSSRRLRGVLSIKEVFAQSPLMTVGAVMHTPAISVSPTTDQETVAYVALQHSLKAVPVVDRNGVFLGAVTSDHIIEILHAESIEDSLRLAGSQIFGDPVQNLMTGSWGLHLRKRLPWLVVGLGGGVLAALVVRAFESTLQEQVLVAAFIPAIVYIADAVGSQTQTLFVRALALDTALPMGRYFGREVVVNLCLAGILGLGMSVVTWLLLGDLLFAVVLGISVYVTVLVAMVTALCIPYGFNRLGIDPGVASGPLATIVRDVLSLFVYLSVVLLLL